MKRVVVAYGSVEPLRLDVDAAALAGDLAGPPGVAGPAARSVVADALAAPVAGPPLQAHVVGGDRVVIAVSGVPPQASEVVGAIVDVLERAGVERPDIAVLHAGGGPPGIPEAVEFQPDAAPDVAYLAADDAGLPLHLARMLVDADVVVPVGEWRHDATLGGRSLDGELWPAFGQGTCRDSLTADLARRGRGALAPWLERLQAVTWSLGAMTSLRLVSGRDRTLCGASFGTPAEASRQARLAAGAWRPVVPRAADLAVCSLSDPHGDFGVIARAVAAAARVTNPDGTICIAVVGTSPPGPVVTRWRQGVPLRLLVREAVRSGDRDFLRDAVVARFLARGLGDRRLVLLSGIDEATVEELGFGFAAGPDAIARLAGRGESMVVIREADAMLPRLA